MEASFGRRVNFHQRLNIQNGKISETFIKDVDNLPKGNTGVIFGKSLQNNLKLKERTIKSNFDLINIGKIYEDKKFDEDEFKDIRRSRSMVAVSYFLNSAGPHCLRKGPSDIVISESATTKNKYQDIAQEEITLTLSQLKTLIHIGRIFYMFH
jgi:hypothetical protein